MKKAIIVLILLFIKNNCSVKDLFTLINDGQNKTLKSFLLKNRFEDKILRQAIKTAEQNLKEVLDFEDQTRKPNYEEIITILYDHLSDKSKHEVGKELKQFFPEEIISIISEYAADLPDEPKVEKIKRFILKHELKFDFEKIQKLTNDEKLQLLDFIDYAIDEFNKFYMHQDGGFTTRETNYAYLFNSLKEKLKSTDKKIQEIFNDFKDFPLMQQEENLLNYARLIFLIYEFLFEELKINSQKNDKYANPEIMRKDYKWLSEFE